MMLVLAAAMMTLLAAPDAFAATGTWTGKISDSTCGLSHKATIAHGGRKVTSAQCVEMCVKGGAKYVLVAGGKVYALANQDFEGLALHAGKWAKVSGDLQGTTITVTKLAKRDAKPPKKD